MKFIHEIFLHEILAFHGIYIHEIFFHAIFACHGIFIHAIYLIIQFSLPQFSFIQFPCNEIFQSWNKIFKQLSVMKISHLQFSVIQFSCRAIFRP